MVGTKSSLARPRTAKEKNSSVHKIAEKENCIVAIMVGTTPRMTLRLWGVKEGVTKEQVENRMQYVSGCRRHALAIWEEATRAGVLHSFHEFDDFLYTRLGLVHERRLITRTAPSAMRQRRIAR